MKFKEFSVSLLLGSMLIAPAYAEDLPNNCYDKSIVCDCNTHFLYVKNTSNTTWNVSEVIETSDTAVYQDNNFKRIEPGQLRWVRSRGLQGLSGPEYTTVLTDGHKLVSLHINQNYCFLKGGKITATSSNTSSISNLYNRDGQFSSTPGISYFVIN